MTTKSRQGFTLIELMIVVGIVAILVALALPSYTRYVRKANRSEAQQLMMQYANNQEIWRANDTNYATAAELPLPTHARYNFFVRANDSNCAASAAPSATQYMVVACAKSGNDQTADEEQAQSCATLTLNQADVKSPVVCW